MREATAHVEQEMFLRALVNATPLAVLKQGSAWGMSESTLSVDSLCTSSTSSHLLDLSSGTTAGGVAGGSGRELANEITPEAGRKASAFMKAMSTLRYAAAG